MFHMYNIILHFGVSVYVFTVALSSDDLLPILIYLVVKTEIPSWQVYFQSCFIIINKTGFNFFLF